MMNRPSETEIAELMKEEIEPVTHPYVPLKVYYYTDLENDELRHSNLTEADRKVIDVALADINEPCVRAVIDLEERPVFSEAALKLQKWANG